MRGLPRRLLLAVLLTAVFGLLAPPASMAYEGEHYVWTYYVALQCGFTERQAYQLASGAYAVDWDPDTGPMPGGFDYAKITWGYPPESQRGIWVRHHAFTENVFGDTGGEQAVEAAKQRHMDRLRLIGRIDGNPGPLLHYTQDYTPHFGWDDVRGHGPAGHLPDFLIADPPGGWKATERTMRELQSFRADRGLPSASCDTKRLRQVFRELMFANPIPVDMHGAVKDLRQRINDSVARRLVVGVFTFPQLAAIYVDSGMDPYDIYTAFAVGPDLLRSLQVVHAAVVADKEEGRLDTLVEGLPPYFGSLPSEWIQFDYDGEGHVRDARYPLEEPTFEVQPPMISTQLTGEGPDARVLIDWRMPFTLDGLAELGFLDQLPVAMTASSPEFQLPMLFRFNGSHAFAGRVNVHRSRVDAGETVHFELAAYGIGKHQVTLSLAADLPPARAPQDTSEVRTLLEELETLADTADGVASRLRGLCASSRELVAELEARTSELEQSLAGLADRAGAIQSAPVSAAATDRSAEVQQLLASAQASSQVIARLRDEAARMVGAACADGVRPAAGMSGRATLQLERLRNVLLQLRGLGGTGRGAHLAQQEQMRAAVEALEQRAAGLLEAARGAHGQLNQAAELDETLRGIDSRAADLLTQILRILEDPTADPAAVSQRANAAWSRIQRALESAAGCGEDLRSGSLNGVQVRLGEVAERARSLFAALEPPPAAAPAAADGLEGALAEVESLVSIAELFHESIVNREREAQECLSEPERETLPPLPESDPSEPLPTDARPTDESGGSMQPGGGQEVGDGWTLGDDIVTLDENPAVPATSTVAEQPAAVPSPAARPSAEDAINAARGAFARCDFASALAHANRARSIEPDHPWLAANLPRIRSLATQQRRTVAGLGRARSLAAAGDLDAARTAMRAAADVAPGCMSDAIADVDVQVTEAIADRRDRGRQALAEGLATLLGAVGQAVAATQTAPSIPNQPSQPWPSAVTPTTPATGGGTAQPSCYALDMRPQLRPILASLDDDERRKVTFYMEEYRMAQGSIYTISPVGVENIAQTHAITDQLIRQYAGSSGLSPPRRSGPYRSLDAAWSAARGRCGNVVSF